MAENTGIEWADHTFNPWIGCTKVSPACDHCYAEEWAKRFKGPAWGKERRRTSTANWQKPLRWNREAAAFRAAHGRAPMVFCASLADVFDNQVPDEWRLELWELIAQTPDLVWLLLTKRPQNIRKMLPVMDSSLPGYRPWHQRWPWPHVWLGTTVENQAEADRRIPHLLSVPAAKRFLSCEPLLGPVDLTNLSVVSPGGVEQWNALDRIEGREAAAEGGVSGVIDWVIAGGESGREARPSHPDWFRSLRDQCAGAGVPFLFKQWGEWTPSELASREALRATIQTVDFNGRRLFGTEAVLGGVEPVEIMARPGKKAAGRTLDGVIHDGRPVA